MSEEKRFTMQEVLQNPALSIAFLEAIMESKIENEGLASMVSEQKKAISEMEGKVEYHDAILKGEQALPISVFAKDYGWSAKRMNRYLQKKGVQYRQGDIWLPYQKYAGLGYTQTCTFPCKGDRHKANRAHTGVRTHWTQKGRQFIYELLKADGVLPVSER